jgi:uncharacterized membrane-anchored protein YjiN (DUF445 family)
VFEATIVWSIVLALTIVKVADIAGNYIYEYINHKRHQKKFDEILANMKLELEKRELRRPVKKAVVKKKPATKRRYTTKRPPPGRLKYQSGGFRVSTGLLCP